MQKFLYFLSKPTTNKIIYKKTVSVVYEDTYFIFTQQSII